MPSCDVVPDSIDLGTDCPNLRPITVVGDRFEPIQMPSNVSWVNIPTHTTVDADQENTVEICYRYLNRIIPKCAYILADS